MKIKYDIDKKRQMITHIQMYIEKEFDLKLGELGSENLLYFVTELIGPTLYNKGIFDARVLISENMLSIEDNLFALEKKSDLID